MAIDRSKINLGKVVAINPKIGSRSMIGVHGDRPVKWGNYFSFADDTYCCNMWAENLEEIVAAKQISQLEVLRYTREDHSWCLVIDQRVPPSWLYNKLCFNGVLRPPESFLREMYAVVGDPTNEIDKYINPVAYFERQGAHYNPLTQTITYNVRR